ncbi:hypothetical protein JJB07_15650 [Tumebacillus sp. ITR2]|uniref:Uncharacterized protein n=1 Tax=Tumebacillus amylolyticus TaxID=2801339 RepID=A0ABS1JCT3_9BACL|nr:hypothetical protein [Tumebacillus amylolyticus]MBL0388053.1 hypothetical protein [Tumebacillus amylolyticus]
MPIRKQMERQVLELLQEAIAHGKRLERSGIMAEDERVVEWRKGASRLLLFAFGELSPYTRKFQACEGAESCLVSARRALCRGGIPNPWLLVEERVGLPSFPRNRAWYAEQQGEDAIWELALSSIWFEKIKL